MARKKRQSELRQGKGISLLPTLWARIDRLADAQDKSRSEVVEDVLTAFLPAIDDLRKTQDTTQSVGETVEVA
jgi:metal-responsive CopG/Arc/MetJ family transcriptional regulator